MHFSNRLIFRGMTVLMSMEPSQFTPTGPCFKMKWWKWVTQTIIAWWFSLPWAGWLLCVFCDQSEAWKGMLCCSSRTFLTVPAFPRFVAVASLTIHTSFQIWMEVQVFIWREKEQQSRCLEAECSVCFVMLTGIPVLQLGRAYFIAVQTAPVN